jgi:hypothetical protein
VNFAFSCSNIPAAPAYGVCFSPSILYSKICGFYDDLLERLLIIRKLLNQGYLVVEAIITNATMTWLTVTE